MAGLGKQLVKVGSPALRILFEVPKRGHTFCPHCGAPVAIFPGDGSMLHTLETEENKDGVKVAPPHLNYCPAAQLRRA